MPSSVKLRCSQRSRHGGRRQSCGKLMTVLRGDDDSVKLLCEAGHHTSYSRGYFNRFALCAAANRQGEVLLPDCCPFCDEPLSPGQENWIAPSRSVLCGGCGCYIGWNPKRLCWEELEPV